MQSTLRQELVRAGRHLYEKGLLCAYEGNLSARLQSGRHDELLITPAGSCKGMLGPRDLLLIPTKDDGQKSPGASSETPLHRIVYACCPGARAVIHAHPPYATAFACTHAGLGPLLQAELVQLLGKPVPLAEFALPGSQELALNMRRWLHEGHRAILMANHGLLCWSEQSLLDACLVAEQVEQVARTTWLARQLGGLHELDFNRLQPLALERKPR